VLCGSHACDQCGGYSLGSGERETVYIIDSGKSVKDRGPRRGVGVGGQVAFGGVGEYGTSSSSSSWWSRHLNLSTLHLVTAVFIPHLSPPDDPTLILLQVSLAFQLAPILHAVPYSRQSSQIQL
jgi:hypothetical protein